MRTLQQFRIMAFITGERLGTDARIPPVSTNLTVHAIIPVTRAPLGEDSSPATLYLTEVSASGTAVAAQKAEDAAEKGEGSETRRTPPQKDARKAVQLRDGQFQL